VLREGFRRWVRDAVVVACCGAAGFGAVAGFRFSEDDDETRERANPRVALSDLAGARDPGVTLTFGSAEAEPPAAAAPTPQDALEQFLGAETRRDYAASYGALSAADRDEIGSPAEWAAAHGELPKLTGFAVGAVRADAERAEVDAEVTFESTLDETRGLVPARAHAVWIARPEDGGWRVAHSESHLMPEYPDDQGATSAAEAWVTARRSCATPREYDGGLIGGARVVDTLCDAPGSIRIGGVAPLESDAGVEPFLAAFGPEVLSWARVVPVTSPVPIAVVLAPVADRWLVIGTLEASSGGSS
jgi:hypothetical protein